jgi:hypothetical protein
VNAGRIFTVRKLDAFLQQPDIKPVFERYFVPVKLVHENEKNKSLENAGADALLRKLGGPSGIPYSAFLDANGGRRTGRDRLVHANDPEAAPKISEEDVKTIESALRHSTKA